jgi:hypothetical protein
MIALDYHCWFGQIAVMEKKGSFERGTLERTMTALFRVPKSQVDRKIKQKHKKGKD